MFMLNQQNMFSYEMMTKLDPTTVLVDQLRLAHNRTTLPLTTTITVPFSTLLKLSALQNNTKRRWFSCTDLFKRTTVSI